LDFAQVSQQVIAELRAVFARIDEELPKRMTTAIMQSRRIACHGVGREGLMLRALAMRLMHLGFDAHVVGDATTPPLSAGDLLIASAGPGNLPTVIALMNVARSAGARILLITAQTDSKAAQVADDVIVLPAQTMANDGDGALRGASSVLPMGSVFEISQLIFFDLIALDLRDQTDQTAEQMRRRHTNLE
jgi:6-phospho-3-hexuloisomerase